MLVTPEELASALARARDFAATWNPGELIHDESGFTRDDLLALIAAVENVVQVPRSL